MIKRVMTLLVLVGLLFPMMTQAWGSHDLKHAIHNAYETQSSISKHDHDDHDNHSGPNSIDTVHNTHHQIKVGIETSGFLYGGTSNLSSKNFLQARPLHDERFNGSHINIAKIYAVNSSSELKRHSAWVFHPPGHSQKKLFLETQRLRI